MEDFENSSLREAQRRSNPIFLAILDCFAEPASGAHSRDPLARSDEARLFYLVVSGGKPGKRHCAVNGESLGGLLDRGLLARGAFLFAISRPPPIRKRVRKLVEIEIHYRRCEQRERLADDQAADHRVAERLAGFRSRASTQPQPAAAEPP